MRISVLLVLLLGIPALFAQQPYSDPAILPKERAHWSFQTPKIIPPKIQDAPAAKQWSRNAIDEYIFATLEQKKLKPSPEADKLTLIRRLTFDLHGLPPTPAEIDTFLKDDAPNAYEKLVDRLLASPHYGERWAQHWLDVVRFAESNGYEMDAERPHAWRYRDYVIRSLNADKPYDRFLKEQIAGDLLAAGKPVAESADLHIATGLHRCGPVHVVSGNVDRDENRQEVLTEMVTGLSSGILGLTVACARCHDHKFDPISAGDFYRLQAFFAGSQYRNLDLAEEKERQARDEQLTVVNRKTAPIKKLIAELEAPVRTRVLAAKKAALPEPLKTAVLTPADKRTPEQIKHAKDAAVLLKIVWDDVLDALSPEELTKRTALKTELRKLEEDLPQPLPMIWSIGDDKTIPVTHVLKRGDVKKKWSEVQPAYLRIVAGKTAAPKTRLDLANWIVQPEHPLTARVMVNRIWQHHFGTGLVATSSDFGFNGGRPSHPELLDWLARKFIEEKWSIKSMHRLIVQSNAYRRSSSITREGLQVDASSRLLWHYPARRLEAEAIRDAILATSSKLDLKAGGPGFDLFEPNTNYVKVYKAKTQFGPAEFRRMIYQQKPRMQLDNTFGVFDCPDGGQIAPKRNLSTTPLQAFNLLNSPFIVQQAGFFAERIQQAEAKDTAAQVRRAFQFAFQRDPTAPEADGALKLLKSHGLAALCRALFNTNEFLYVD